MTNNTTPTAKRFIERLKTYQSPAEREKLQRYFVTPSDGEVDQFMGVRMGQVFTLAKEFIAMTPDEIEKLLESKIHEVRAGACSIMDKQARSKKTTPERRKELYDLYLRRHDRINNWDLVDVCAIHVVGGYLSDKPRKILYKLARSKNMWERRTAIVSTAYLIRKGELDDTYKIAEMLLGEKEDLVHKATGWMLRFAGDKDRPRLLKFLDQHAATMPRVALRYSMEHLDKKQREHYLGLKKKIVLESMISRMNDGFPKNPGWFPMALLVGALYFLLGVVFATLASWAATSSTRVIWNRLGFLISGIVFALHIAYEHYRLRSSRLITATHVSIAVALGAFALAVNANIHGYRVGSGNKRLLAFALVAWPAITAIPAFVVALATAAMLRLRQRTP